MIEEKSVLYLGRMKYNKFNTVTCRKKSKALYSYRKLFDLFRTFFHFNRSKENTMKLLLLKMTLKIFFLN